jgi:hypothetical protein
METEKINLRVNLIKVFYDEFEGFRKQELDISIQTLEAHVVLNIL